MGAITTEVVDTGERRDGRGRRVIPRAQRVALIEAYRSSGMSMAAFARRERINYTTFAGWLHRLGSLAASSPIRFAEVKVPAIAAPSARSGHELEVRLADGTVLRGGRVADLIVLVRGLRS
jgi:transposase-like protein